MPFPFDSAEVRSRLHELIQRNDVREGTARIYAVYNKVGFWQSGEDLPEVDLMLCTAGLPSYREPVRLSLCEHGRHAASPLAGTKVTSWLFNVWTLQGAQQRGFDEALLLNERGEIAECTAANIFCARDGRVLTPPLSSGCLEGVTRGILLEIAPATGIPMEEKLCGPLTSTPPTKCSSPPPTAACLASPRSKATNLPARPARLRSGSSKPLPIT